MKNSSNRLIFPTFVCMEGSADKIFEVLKRYWGFTEFRPVQERIIRSAMAGRDTLALMPTGGGKSLTYQVPGLAQPGLCIVVTPLIALMKDQVDRLRARRIPAVAIHSGLSPRQIDIALDNCVYGDVKFLYVAPERLATEAFRLRVERMKVSLLAVDEAHCISQWGYDFRPSYLRIAELREKLPGVPVLTLLEVGRVKVRFSVPEQEIARLGADSRIGVGVAALGDRVFPAGKIEKGAVANPAAHTYDVRATLDNAAGELLPGMVCRVTVSPAESAEEIAVPLRAVQQAGDGSRFVWTVRGDSAVRTAVTTGRLVNNGIVLTGGVAAGDRIVVDGMQKIGEGSKVVW